MVRLVIIVLLAYFAYKLFKGVFNIGPKLSGRDDSTGIISEMVQDPICKTYIPRNEAYRVVLGGKEILFCSKECAEKFKQENK